MQPTREPWIVDSDDQVLNIPLGFPRHVRDEAVLSHGEGRDAELITQVELRVVVDQEDALTARRVFGDDSQKLLTRAVQPFKLGVSESTHEVVETLDSDARGFGVSLRDPCRDRGLADATLLIAHDDPARRCGEADLRR